MILKCQRKYNNIIDVDQCEYPEKWRQNVLHDLLEDAWSVLVSERHSDELPQTSMRSES
jgi:hypothetical protein